jgi:hypothetical protein
MILCDNAIKFSRDDVSPPCVACRPLGKLESLIFHLCARCRACTLRPTLEAGCSSHRRPCKLFYAINLC